MSLQVNIEKRLESFTLRVAFEAEGEVMALLGASGSGKSMTLKCIAGLETPDRGRIVLDGTVLFDSESHINLPPQKRKIGYLFQQYALFPNMTVRQNILAGAHAAAKADRIRITEDLMARFRLNGLENKRPGQLSGGQQQRTALARILASAPHILLLDEPLSALDSYLKWTLEMELSDLLREFTGASVWVSHDRNEVYRNCDSVCVLSDGRSETKRSVSELFATPETVASCLLTGCKNFSKIRRTDSGRVYAEDWAAELRVDAPDTGANVIGIRAHYILPVREPGENVLSCRVDRIVEDVFSTIVMVTPEGASGKLRIEMEKEVWKALDNPKELLLYLDPKAIMLLHDSEVV